MERRNFLKIFSGTALATICSPTRIPAATYPKALGTQTAVDAFGVQPLFTERGLTFNLSHIVSSGNPYREESDEASRSRRLHGEKWDGVAIPKTTLSVEKKVVKCDLRGEIDGQVWGIVHKQFEAGGDFETRSIRHPFEVAANANIIGIKNRIAPANQIIGTEAVFDKLYEHPDMIAVAGQNLDRFNRIQLRSGSPMADDCIYLNQRGDQFLRTGATVAPVISSDFNREELDWKDLTEIGKIVPKKFGFSMFPTFHKHIMRLKLDW